MKRYVISDLHLGHTGILKHRTQFESIDHMHCEILNNWNKTVAYDDKVYILGDVAFSKTAMMFLGLMHGKKILIKGNHDTLKLKEYEKYFYDIRGAYEYQGCILTHIPVHECQLIRFKFNVHGHMHDKSIMKKFAVIYPGGGLVGQKIPKDKQYVYGLDPRYINVCCEQVNYTPVLLDEIISDT